MSDEEEKRKRIEENRRKFEEESRRRQQNLTNLFSRGSGRHMGQTLYSRPTRPTQPLPGTVATSREDLNRPIQRPRVQMPTQVRQRHPAGDLDSLAQGLSSIFSSSVTLGPSASTSGMSTQQTEPSVRPKVRTRIPPPPIESTIPEPDIVHRFSDETTGDPDLRKLQFRTPFLPQVEQRDRPLHLANISRDQTNQIMSYDRRRNFRKNEYLRTDPRGFRPELIDPEKGTMRYHPQRRLDDLPSTSRPMLQPQRSKDNWKRYDPRFNKPLQEMDTKPITTLPHAPVGRQSYGHLSRRSMSLPDLSSQSQFDEFPSHQEEYNARYRRLPKEHRDTYDDYRKQITWEENPLARNRMVRQPTLMNIGDTDKERLGEMYGQRLDYSTGSLPSKEGAEMLKRARRQYVQKRAELPPTIPNLQKIKWMRNIVRKPISEEPEEPEEEEDSDSDS